MRLGCWPATHVLSLYLKTTSSHKPRHDPLRTLVLSVYLLTYSLTYYQRSLDLLSFFRFLRIGVLSQ